MSKVWKEMLPHLNLPFKGLCIANIFAEYNQQDATFHNLFISVRCSTCFRRFFCPSPGAQNCTYSIRYWSDKYLTLYVQFWGPGDGRKNRLKHVEGITEINKLRKFASCSLYSVNILATHGYMNVKFGDTAYSMQINLMIYVARYC
jgi:hypothetical protein